MTTLNLTTPTTSPAAIRAAIAGYERRLYDAATPRAERADLSMTIAELRDAYGAATGARWTPDEALDTPDEE